jgi:hypothetical protein
MGGRPPAKIRRVIRGARSACPKGHGISRTVSNPTARRGIEPKRLKMSIRIARHKLRN